MSRFPAAKKSEATKTFYVAEGFIIGDPTGSGKRLKGGDPIALTKAQAEHLMKMRAINVELPDFGPETGPDDSDPSEGSSGDQVEGEGDAASGGSSAQADDENKGNSAPRRTKAKL